MNDIHGRKPKNLEEKPFPELLCPPKISTD
jgi:hypothetical protein